MKKIVFWVAQLLLLPVLLFSQSNPNELFIYSLEDQWTVYDYSSKVYLPYFKDLYSNINKLHTNLNKEEYEGLNIAIEGDSAATLFINNQFMYVFRRKQLVNFRVDSLKSRYIFNNILQLTYYTQTDLEKVPTAYITLRPYYETVAFRQSTESTMALRKNTISKNLFGLAGLFAFSMVAVISSLHTPLFRWSQLWRNLSNFLQGRNQVKRLQSSQFIWYMLFYAFTVAFTVIVCSKSYLLNPVSLNHHLLMAELTKFLVYVLCFALFIILKYILVWVMGNLYNNKNLPTLHFQEMIVVSQIIVALMLLVSSLVALSGVNITNGVIFLRYFVLALLGIQALLMTYRLREALKYSWFYFFSYISTTELIPFFLYLKLFLSL